MQHVLMAGVWSANFFLLRQPIGQTVCTRVADLKILTTGLGYYTKNINDKNAKTVCKFSPIYTFHLYVIHNDQKICIS